MKKYPRLKKARVFLLDLFQDFKSFFGTSLQFYEILFEFN